MLIPRPEPTPHTASRSACQRVPVPALGCDAAALSARADNPLPALLVDADVTMR
jgi:hypothetical protein